MLTHTLKRNRLFVAAIALLFCATIVDGQTTSFTYQGRMIDGGTAANGTYDLQFALFDSLAGETQIGTTQTIPIVAVSLPNRKFSEFILCIS